MRFDWDEEKSRSNSKKHGVRFAEAQTVFLDPWGIDLFDILHSHAEDRFVRIGASKDFAVLVVVYCESDAGLRIISARRATAEERRQYEERI